MQKPQMHLCLNKAYTSTWASLVAHSKESACNAGDVGLIPESGRSPGGGHSYPLQHSCLENSMDRGAWQATVLGVAELDMTKATEHTHIPVLKTDMDLRGNRSFKC